MLRWHFADDYTHVLIVKLISKIFHYSYWNFQQMPLCRQYVHAAVLRIIIIYIIYFLLTKFPHFDTMPDDFLSKLLNITRRPLMLRRRAILYILHRFLITCKMARA